MKIISIITYSKYNLNVLIQKKTLRDNEQSNYSVVKELKEKLPNREDFIREIIEPISNAKDKCVKQVEEGKYDYPYVNPDVLECSEFMNDILKIYDNIK